MSNPVIRPMMEGPIDIIGDIHGELGALQELMRHLGYEANGRHPDGRRMVFVGDLCDRGPDSPGVATMVKGWWMPAERSASWAWWDEYDGAIPVVIGLLALAVSG